MTEPCLSIEELLALADRTAGGEHWKHVRGCARCSGRLKAYGLFLTLGADQPAPGEEEAIAQVRRMLLEQDHATTTASPCPAGGRRRWSPRLLVPSLGAVAILAGVLLLVRQESPRPRATGIVRESPALPRATELFTEPALLLPDGSIELRWHACTGADAYSVRLLDSGLREVTRLAARVETSQVVPRALLADQAGRAAFWQVQALQAGDPIAGSTPEPILQESPRPSRR